MAKDLNGDGAPAESQDPAKEISDEPGPLLDIGASPQPTDDDEEDADEYDQDDDDALELAVFNTVMVAADIRWGSEELERWRVRLGEVETYEEFAVEVARAHPDSTQDIASGIWDCGICFPEDGMPQS